MHGKQLAGTDDDFVFLGAHLQHEAGLTVGGGAAQCQALALAYGVCLRAGVLAEHLTVGVLDEAGAHCDVVTQPGAGITFGDEADVVGIRLLRHGEAALCRLRAYLCLGGGVRQGEPGVLELFVGEHTEHVGLVLGPVGGAVQFAVAVFGGDDAGVVAGHHGVEAEREGAFEERGELDLFVAAHAGVGGSSGFVFGDEVVDNIFLEAFGEVPDEEGDAQLGADAAGVHGVFEGATAAGAGAQGAGHAG